MIAVAVILGGGVAANATKKYVEIRELMKKGDEEIEKERQKEREEEAMENKMRQPKKWLHHFTHNCLLTEFKSESNSHNCNICNQCIKCDEWVYRCKGCNYYLHKVCTKDLVALTPCSYSRAKETQTPVDQTIISTFAHAEHMVKDIYSNIDYRCHHCNTAGCGKRFHCEACNVNLHPVCATCPTKISSFMHPNHDLELKTRPHFVDCAICNKKGKSNSRMYRCKACEFYVHPACSQLPQHLMHDLHPPHPLSFKLTTCSRRCDANCSSICEKGEWSYECKICNVTIHIKCILRHSSLGMSNKKELEVEGIIQLLTEVSSGIIEIGVECCQV